jgi:hypothetical protein
MRSASALRFSKGCSSLNLDRMVMVDAGRNTRRRVWWFGMKRSGGKEKSGRGVAVGCVVVDADVAVVDVSRGWFEAAMDDDGL